MRKSESAARIEEPPADPAMEGTAAVVEGAPPAGGESETVLLPDGDGSVASDGPPADVAAGNPPRHRKRRLSRLDKMDWLAIRRSRRALRRAMVLKTILDEPRALYPYRPPFGKGFRRYRF